MAIPPSGPRSSGTSSSNFPPYPGDAQESSLLANARDKATRCWTAAQAYFSSIFPSRSAPLIDAAIRETTLTTSVPPSIPLSEGVEGLESAENPINDSAASAPLEKSESTEPNNRAKIGGVLMEFTVKINGKDTPLSHALLAQLQPIFDELAKTPDGQTKLKTGFTCTIRFSDLQNIKFYHNGIEILKGATEDLFKNKPDLFKHMEIFKRLYEQNELDLNDASSINEKASVVDVRNSFIVKADGDGNCLLHAAIYHIKKKQPSRYPTPKELREAIAKHAQQELDNNTQGNWINCIANDILDAQAFAKDNNLQETDRFRPLCEENITNQAKNCITGSAGFELNLLVETYKTYVLDNLDTAPTSLGAYAIYYLNKIYFDNKLLVVRQQGASFISIGDVIETPQIDLTNDDKSKTPVILYDGRSHYNAIDSSDPKFWEAYKPRTQS